MLNGLVQLVKRSILLLQDLQIIHAHLAGMDALSKLRESALQLLCKMVRYERHDANDILYWSVG